MVAIDEDVALIAAWMAREKAESRNDLRHRVPLPPLYPLQQRIKAEAARFNTICIGRRAGKTYLCTHLALETALQGQPVGWFVPDYKVAAEVWRDVSRALKPVATKLNATERRIEIENGGVLDVWTLENEDAGRGRKYKRVVVDEAAMASSLEVAWNQAIRPTLTDLQGDAWFPSTPKGLNYYYHLFQRGIDPTQTDWRSWQLPSSVNPYLPAGEIEAARLELPELVFKQEYLAEFISSDGAVFRNVELCCIHEPASPHDHAGHQVVAGVDWGQSHDFTVISVYCCTCNRELVLDRFNQIGWGLQRGRLHAQMQRWGIRYVLVESNSIGSPNLEQLQKDVGDEALIVGFETTRTTKPEVVQQLALSLEKRSSEWLRDEVARLELLAFEATKTESGYTKYGAPEGQHDDTVMARCLAWEAKRRNPVSVLSIREQVQLKMPPTWRDAYIAQQSPEMRDRLYMAREEEYEEALAHIESQRRPSVDVGEFWEGGHWEE